MVLVSLVRKFIVISFAENFNSVGEVRRCCWVSRGWLTFNWVADFGLKYDVADCVGWPVANQFDFGLVIELINMFNLDCLALLKVLRQYCEDSAMGLHFNFHSTILRYLHTVATFDDAES